MNEGTHLNRSGRQRLLRRVARRALPPSWLGSRWLGPLLGVRSEHGHLVESVGGLVLEYSLESVIGQLLYLRAEFEDDEAAIIAGILSGRRDAVVVDVGANIGLHSLRIAGLPDVARVYAFEPGRATFAMLERNLQRNRAGAKVAATAQAVAAQSGRAEFHFCADDAYSSLAPDNRRPVQETYPVDVISLDDWSALHRPSRIDLIKIDVEGAEPEVIRGAHATLRRYRPELIVEIYQGNRAGFSAAALISEICALDYEPFVLVEGRLVPFTSHSDDHFNYRFRPIRRET